MLERPAAVAQQLPEAMYREPGAEVGWREPGGAPHAHGRGGVSGACEHQLRRGQVPTDIFERLE